MSKQLFNDGDTFEHEGETLECVLVQYRERDGEKENFVYGFRLKSELDAERESARKVEEDQEKARKSEGEEQSDGN